jgi:hypothetical protein
MQARWILPDCTVSDEEYDDLHETLEDERDSHRERRSITLRHTAALIAEKEHRSESRSVTSEHLKRTHRDVRNSLDHVDHAITIFSPWRRCNVGYDIFSEELRQYYRGRASG